MTQTATVIDIGGTHMRWAKWSADKGVGTRKSITTPSFHQHPDMSVQQLQQRLVKTITEIPVCDQDKTVGISFGAAMNHRNATVYASAPLWGAHNVPFDLQSELIRLRPDVKWHVVNDVTAALLHVITTPLCAQDRKVMLVTISTGIAARTIDRATRHIPFDSCGLQGEIGHLPATTNLGREMVHLLCDCGELNHLSSFSSGRGIARMADLFKVREPQQWADSMLGRTIEEGSNFEQAFSKALHTNDPVAKALLSAVTLPVADVLRTALCLDPDLDKIVITGGVAVSLGEHYRSAILEQLRTAGLYLTSHLDFDWIATRIVVAQADCLAGAGVAATFGAW